jgi:hypothetical protein
MMLGRRRVLIRGGAGLLRAFAASASVLVVASRAIIAAAPVAMFLMFLIVPATALARFGRAAETFELLAQRLDVAFVGGLLAIGFFQDLEHLLHAVENFLKLGHDRLDRVHRVTHGSRRRRLLWTLGARSAPLIAALIPAPVAPAVAVASTIPPAVMAPTVVAARLFVRGGRGG